jgi:hypothetical protein
MGGKSRYRLWGDRVNAARVHVNFAREQLIKAIRDRDEAVCRLWSHQMEGFGGPAQPSPTIGQAINGGYFFIDVQCKRCKTQSGIELLSLPRKRETPIWTLEASLTCRHCAPIVRYRPQTILVRLSKGRETSSAPWYHPSENDGHSR